MNRKIDSSTQPEDTEGHLAGVLGEDHPAAPKGKKSSRVSTDDATDTEGHRFRPPAV